MRTSLPLLLVASAVAFPASSVHADDPALDYGSAGPYIAQPEYLDEEHMPYRPPPEGICYDEDNQVYDCSSDAEYASYGQVDDGYDASAYLDFQSALAPYGTWFDSPQYGMIWNPSPAVVGYDFTPYYSGGRWMFTDYGWTWVSDYDWGWAPFHYGRWVTLTNYGWCWVPGRIWGPAWVHWRQGGGYVGWSPLPPRGIRIPPPYMGGRYQRWNFVPAPQLTAPRLIRVSPLHLPGVFARTAPGNVLRSIGTTRVNIGPLPGSLSMQVLPSPLRALTQALPRAHVSVRAGVPLVSRPYLPGLYRGPTIMSPRPRPRPLPFMQAGPQRPVFSPPAFPQRPAFSPPAFPQRPAFSPPAFPQRPAFSPPAFPQRPAFSPPAFPQRPSMPARPMVAPPPPARFHR